MSDRQTIRLLERLSRRMRNIVARGVISLVRDAHKWQSTQLELLDGEVLDPFSTKQYLVGSRGSRVMFDAESSGCVALWIDVNHKHVEAAKSEGGSAVHGRGRLPDTALLVGDHENAGFFRARQR